ncbi:hypothetical protein SpiGrapes_2332 [Sphaerochaeta pleomorpha str. Grapes]|uniref:YdhG-like domain-containing protein n=1 Tax=Sphaerochaeta pleomorpha (strain ATCC BAA-1885 / DSM 22778 / Grapes) TaxID=158190 RepID=G8QSS5_SPHPG|nr:DUF1801 domain-containing protein [Sphaerochaeta pleomorpha]AEV30107.1 hypothetical protein SpiGrapes_2332 [Sphaerochaeta pleomorpha str. Grapes]
MERFDTRVDAYISTFPPAVQLLLLQLRAIIHEEAPDVVETISWGMPTFKYKGTLVFFAGFKKHIGFYPLPSGIEAFAHELAGYHTSKGTIQFPLGAKLPEDLIRKLLRYRIAENEEKAKESRH